MSDGTDDDVLAFAAMVVGAGLLIGIIMEIWIRRL